MIIQCLPCCYTSTENDASFLRRRICPIIGTFVYVFMLIIFILCLYISYDAIVVYEKDEALAHTIDASD